MSELKEIIARAAGESYDGYADPVATPSNWSRAMSAADAILHALDAAGRVVVPKEPTKEMVAAGDDEKENCLDSDWDSGPDGESCNTYTTLRSDAPAQIYRAMLASAPGTGCRAKEKTAA